MDIGNITQRELDHLGRLPSVLDDCHHVADVIRDEARRLTPVRTGRLRRSLYVYRGRNAEGQVEWRVGWDERIADYGPHVEFGTSDTPPQPHLRPAANKVRGR